MDRIVDLIRSKRDGEELSFEDYERLISAYARGEVTEYQMAALLMAGCCTEFTDNEATALTSAMLKCGERLDLSAIERPKVDKHSTGGVGDKVSLIAGPIAAAAGIVVPMVSGRGLGHTGGTLDKLESIPGLRTTITPVQFQQQAAEHGLVYAAQSNEIAPVDKKLYALRNATATVDSLALIASSIMSKKLAEGLNGLVLDVKVGRGSLIPGRREARRLAQLMISIGRRMDVSVQALLTDMNEPLGFTIGNALEVMEAAQALQNQGPPDLVGLSIEVAARMIYLGESNRSIESARDQAQELLTDGSALAKFTAVIAAQGGDAEVLTDFQRLPNATGEQIITSPRTGFISRINADDIGQAASMLGAGRDSMDDDIDHAVGVVLQCKVGDQVAEGSRLCALYYTDETNVQEAVQLVEDAFRLSASQPEPRELALDLVQ
ncbi:MAG: thymidine phosphorylase [Solibacterales bacterium]|nr:thymidine phosphorylase [Bryobacterales bacterium]|tara:strand:+ start:5651 stop:6958 length:1308 start_codon:yes stop_codon:yes gene_type:complete